MALISIALLLRSLELPENQRILYQTGARATFLAGTLIVLSGLTPIDTIPLLLVLITFLLAPVLFGILVWIKVLDARELEM